MSVLALASSAWRCPMGLSLRDVPTGHSKTRRGEMRPAVPLGRL
jgi:hypothetical protein